MQSLAFGHVIRADSPILVVTPHSGTQIPEELLRHPAWAPIQGRIADPAGIVLGTLAVKRGMTTVGARYHPCVIDFNVATDNRPLSPRLNRTGLCRTHTSRGEALYEGAHPPSEQEVEARVEQYWRPFHAAVTAEVQRLRQLHPHVLLLVSHASSWLSPYRNQTGALDCNVGSNRGRSCDRRLVSALTDAAGTHGRSWVVNGKVADMFAAQHYGTPEEGIHAIETEIAGRWRAALEFEHEDPDDGAASAALSAMLEALERAIAQLPHASPQAGADHAAASRLAR
jgi:N-formylglutamate deformylase